MNWNDKAEQMKEQKELIELALKFKTRNNSIKNAVSELEDYAENYDRTEDEINCDNNEFAILETLFDCKSMQVLFHKDMSKAERVSYFHVACELLRVIFDDMNDEALVQKINDEQILKRLFQFSKKTRSAKDMTEDCHAPFENSNYL